MKFLARLGWIIPGSFVGWRVSPINKEFDPSGAFKHPVIPDVYVIDNVDAVINGIGIVVEYPNGLWCVPVIKNVDKLRTAIFEFDKTARGKFRIVRYVGEAKITPMNVEI